MERFKTIAHKLKLEEYRRPAGAWFYAVASFFVLLVAMSVALFWYERDLISLSRSQDGTVKKERLDQEKLRIIAADQAVRQEAYQKLLSEKPAVVDPGI